MGKNVKGSDPVLSYGIISTLCVCERGGWGVRTVSKYAVFGGRLNLITAKYQACEFELLYHDVNLYFGEINLV